MFISIQLTTRILYTLGKSVLPFSCQIGAYSMNSFVLHALCHSCTCSGLGSSAQRSGVRRPEDLRPVRLLLAVSPRHRDRLAFLQTAGGSRSGSPRSASCVFGSFWSSAKEERMTIAVRTGHVFCLGCGCFSLRYGALVDGLFSLTETALPPSSRHL